MRMKSVVAAAALAFALSSNADQWFDADIANISSWPAADWSNTDNTSFENSAIKLDGASNLTYTAPSSTNLNRETIITVTTTMKFTAYEKDDFPAFPLDGKAGVIVMETDSGLAYYGLAKVDSANTWVKLTGATPTEVSEVDVIMSLKGDKVQYKIDSDVLAYSDETWLDVVASGAVSETVYSGIGEISSLRGVAEPAPIEVVLKWPEGYTAVSYRVGENEPVAISGASPFTVQNLTAGDVVTFTFQNADGATKTLPATAGTKDEIDASDAAFVWADYLGEAVNGAYTIDDANDLDMLRKGVASGLATSGETFKQTADIDMSEAGAFAGIGTYNVNPTAGKPFAGTYDGGDFKICNVTMTARNYGGVFNQVVGGTIKNLTVENINVADGASNEYGYAIVGHAANGATLQNLTATGSFLSSDKPGTHNMAGIVVRVCGGADSATVTTVANCTNNAAIYGAYTKLAGVCAIAQTQTGFTAGSVLFQNCANTGTLTSSYDSTKATGLAGILAYSTANTVLDGCTNTGTLSNTSEAANTDVNGSLVGTVQNYTLTLKSAIASGDIGKFNAGCTVALDFDVSGNNVDFNLYGKTDSTVELLQNFTGYPARNAVINPTLKLSANMTINDGWKNETNATFAVVTGTGNLTMSNAQATRWYVITKLQNYSGVISAGSYEKVAFGDIVAEAGYGTALVKAGSNFNVDDLASTKVNGAPAVLCVDTLDNQKGIYLAAAQVVADDNSTTGYASVENALAAADAANASSVNVLDENAEEVAATGWSYENGVYTSTREVATLNDTSYPSLTKALAAAQDGDTVMLVAASPEAVTIPAGVTVAVTDDVVFSGKLSGAGAIKYTKAPASFNAAWFVNWTGTFVVAWNATDDKGTGLPFNTYGVDGSVVEIAGNFTGYAGAGSTVYAQVKPTVKVTGTYTPANGSSTTASVFKKVTGSGTINFAAGNKKYAIDALEDWSGTITCGSANCVLTNLVSGTGSVTYSVAAPEIWVGDDFGGTVTFSVAPGHGPNVSNESECEVVIGYNWSSDADIMWYGGSNSTIVVTSFTGNNTYFPATEKILSKVRVAEGGEVAINNGWNISLNNFAWTADRVVEIPALKVDGTFSLAYGQTKWENDSYGAFYVKSLDASGAGSITVGNRFALRIDAVDFAEAPSSTDVLVDLTLAGTGDTAGLLYGPNGVAGEQIPVTVNGVATEQTLVYDAAKSGLVLYVAPTPVAIDPSAVVINYNCYATLSVTGYPEGATFGWTMYTNGVACTSSQGPVKISSGKNNATVKVYSENSAFDGVVAKVAITNGEDVIEREATITVADVAAKIGETEYTKAQLDNAIAEAISSGEVLEHYLGVSTTISKGQTLKTKKLAERSGTASVKAAASTTAGEAWTIVKTEEDGVITWSVGTETPYFEFTSADSQTVEYLASPKNAAGVNKLLSDATITKQFSVTKDGVVLDLNGHALTSTFSNTSSGAFYVNVIWPAPAALTVKDSVGGGSIAAASAHSVFMLGNNGQLTVEGGSFTGNHIVYGSKTTSAATITGGTFTATDAGFTLNMLDSARGTITVTGGTFTGFNPANNSAEGAGTNFVPNGYVSTETSTGVWTVSKSAGGFPGGADGKTFTIDGEVTLPAGKDLTDTASAATGLTYAQAAVLGLLDEEGALKKDVTPTIEVKNGKVVVSLDGTAVDATRYTVMLNVYESAAPIAASAETGWTLKKTYQLGDAEAAGFEPGSAVSGFYMVGVTIEDAE